ncbi:MAG: class I SAM-dependent DNA methyltransferase [Oceanicaulis sp.]|nr:class I SAM-dependent DNA methyltransferase [Oceanicaulis sp.]
MRLDFREVRVRAARFAEDWAHAHYEKGETQTFYNEFFEIFGVSRRRVATYEQRVKLLDNRHGFIDLFWPGVLLVEQKSAGRDLVRAAAQAMEYADALKPGQYPRYILLSDFQTFELLDLETRETAVFPLHDLPAHVERFGFIMGVEKRSFKDQDPVNILAAEQLGKLHDALKDSGYDGHDLEQFLVRLLFCLFADSTGIFEPRGVFEETVADFTREDGADTGSFLIQLFEILNRPEDQRQKALPDYFTKFPYINGELFAERLRTPAFDAAMRKLLMEACSFNWEKISPAIFGSLFQSVMDGAERRKAGAHYTTEKNIMKVIGPLFLDDLRAEFEHLKGLKRDREKRLRAFHDKLAGLHFLDPACGCGNFLVIAYRELRQLELEVLLALSARERDAQGQFQRKLDITGLSRVDVDQFAGIELFEFPARIAETAMWMMDHIMNNALSQAFGQVYARIPLTKSPVIHHGDALEADWADVLAPEQCDYVLGNPPFIGAKYQSAAQRQQVRALAGLGGTGGTLDYVCAWFIKAGAYVNAGGKRAHIGFVSTNSITQGEQVAQLWPILFDRHALEISFAHRTFAWGSDARGKAHVHVVIIGLAPRGREPAEKRLFSYEHVNGEPVESRHGALSPYLFDAGGLADPHTVVEERSSSLSGMPKVIIGSKPIDGGHYIFDEAERDAFLRAEPAAAPFMRPFVGAEEFINGRKRWILSLHAASPSELKAMPQVMERIARVRDVRLASKSPPTQKLAETPTLYHVNIIPERPFLVLPKVSSERREYTPIGWLEPPIVPSDLVFVVADAQRHHFAVLTSAMHMAWLREVGGRLESRYRYSIGIVYNTFPWPDLDGKAKAKLDALGQAILDARASFPDATLADLYDPDTMPPALRKAHRDNDRAVDRLYRSAAFGSDRERVEHLFMLYEKLKNPIVAATKDKPKRARRRTAR